MIGIRIAKLLIVLLATFQSVNAVYFYLDTNEKRCFYEDLAGDTLLSGKVQALDYNEYTRTYEQNRDLTVQVSIYETFDNNDQVYNNKGDITFNSVASGEHMICLSPVYLDGRKGHKHRVHFDLAMGDSADYLDSKSTRKVDELTLMIRNLNKKMEEVHSQQEQMRSKEAVFRDQSESTNSRVVKWTIIQILVLGGTCFYQLKHLKSFFVKQKIV